MELVGVSPKFSSLSSLKVVALTKKRKKKERGEIADLSMPHFRLQVTSGDAGRARRAFGRHFSLMETYLAERFVSAWGMMG
jgi:hypothetical protein